MIQIWGRFVPWVFLGLALAIGAEIGQSFGVVEGTYDTLDIVFYLGRFIFAGVAHAQALLVNYRTLGNDFPRVR